jgi:hypothetical protein
VIQIFGCRTDPHVKAVTGHLLGVGCDFRILDIFDPASDGLTAEISPGLELSLATTPEKSSQPKVVWWRIKPAFLISTGSIVDYYDEQFSLREWLATLDSMSVLHKDCTWVNSRAANTLALNKMHQLEIASRLGFLVPKTLVSNNAKRVRHFISSLNGHRCIHKTAMPYICPDGKQKYTSFIDSGIVDAYVAEVERCPSIYQEYVRPKFELRITAVGDQFFAARIDKKNVIEPDWRREIMDDIYARFELCDKSKQRLVNLQRAFGLTFAAYDFLVNEDGEFVFLEVNPAGQWLWIEERLDLPISRALAQCLVGFCSPETP